MALMLGYGTLQNFYKVSMYLIILQFTFFYKYMHEKQQFFCMSAFVRVHPYNFYSRRQDERTK